MKKKGKVSDGKWFSAKLLQWNKEKNFRQMPWKGEKNPYKIWLSEIILQQTRVEQGLNYYHRFIEIFPDINKLANASDQKIFKLWEGLGYYSRCRNLISTARYISKERKGKFPETYEEIKSLKGIGPYTAAALSSFAFNLPYAVLDGNVFRVLSRIFGIETAIDSAEGKKYFTGFANELLDKTKPGIYNQSIMDFGAVICKPVTPLCKQCPFNKTCYAFLNNKINSLPVKEKKIKIKKRWFYYFVIEFNNKIAIRQRTGKDIWQQLYEFPMMEISEAQSSKKILKLAEKMNLLSANAYRLIAISESIKQQLSHQTITGRFIAVKINERILTASNWKWVTREKLKDYAFPKIINQYLENAIGKNERGDAF